jgi:hypothetical protein
MASWVLNSLAHCRQTKIGLVNSLFFRSYMIWTNEGLGWGGWDPEGWGIHEQFCWEDMVTTKQGLLTRGISIV